MLSFFFTSTAHYLPEMVRPPKTLADAAHLLQLSELITVNIRTVIDAWAKESKAEDGDSADGSPHILPSHQLHQAQRTILASVGALTELVSEPSIRVIEVACQYWESRALAIAAERRIPDLLAQAGTKGLAVEELGKATGIEQLKLCTQKNDSSSESPQWCLLVA